jgi:hypothetical protein
VTAASRRSIACASALALALAPAGCGGGNGDRERVNDYLRQANTIQDRAAPEFKRANDAYLHFSQGKLAAAEAPSDLAHAERSMRITREQLATLSPPAPARELSRRLLALYDADTALAHESTLLARYVPAAAKASAPLAKAARALARSLKSATPAAQAAALDRYAAAVARTTARFRKLRPPPLLNADYGAQLRRLESSGALARRLASAVRRRDSTAVAKLLLRFQRLGSAKSAGTVGPGAVAAYNRRYEKVRRALAAVQRERARLDRVLG